jgi:hypothetical protein
VRSSSSTVLWNSSACRRSRSMNTSTFSGLPEEGAEFFDGPDMVGESSLHRWRHSERLMHATDVILHEV